MFLGIGPGEFLLILIILLLVIGPERMPEFARRAGEMIVQVRNWMQRSPDALMVLRARQEIEQELASLRTSLLEVQHVRNEVLEVVRTVNQTVVDDVLSETRQALGAAQGVPGTVGRRPNGTVVTVPEPDAPPAVPEPTAAPEPPAPAPPPAPTNGAGWPAAPAPGLPDRDQPPAAPTSDATAAFQRELAALREQLMLVATDLTMLRRDLSLRGLLDGPPGPAIGVASSAEPAPDKDRE